MSQDFQNSNLFKTLSKYPGFKEGYFNRIQLIELGEKLSSARKFMNLSLQEVAQLADIQEDRLAQIEDGFNNDSVTLDETQRLFEFYSNHVISQGGKVQISYTLENADGTRYTFDINPESHS